MPTPLTLVDAIAAKAFVIADSFSCRRDGYQPSRNQVAFFVFAWFFNTAKKQMLKGERLPRFTRTTPLMLDPTVIDAQCRTTAAHLVGESGEQVTLLKNESPVEWAALYKTLQMRLKRLHGHQLDAIAQDEVLAQVLDRVLRAIRQMVHGAEIDQQNDVVDFAFDRQEAMATGYNFSRPFQSYVESILPKEAMRYLKSASKESARRLPLEEEVAIAVGVEADLVDEVEQAEQRQKLKQLLPTLFAALETLPSKRRLVALYTLAGREQFWHLLDIAEWPVPTALPAKSHEGTDEAIGAALDLKPNNVRVHRRQAYLTLHAADPAVGKLFKVLIDVHF